MGPAGHSSTLDETWQAVSDFGTTTYNMIFPPGLPQDPGFASAGSTRIAELEAQIACLKAQLEAQQQSGDDPLVAAAEETGQNFSLPYKTPLFAEHVSYFVSWIFGFVWFSLFSLFLLFSGLSGF